VKKLLLLSLLTLALLGATTTTTPLIAQSVDAGVKSYESGQYRDAIKELDAAITSGGLKEKALARALYYRGQSKLVLVRKNHTDPAAEMSKLVHEWAISGMEDLVLAKKNDIDAKLTEPIAASTKEMFQLSLDIADADLLSSTDGNLKEADKKALWESMIKLCEPVMANDKFNYRAYDLTADAQLSLRDSLKALKNYHFADDWFFRSAPKDGDMAIAYTYVHIAELEWALNKNYDVAIKAIEEGKQVLDGEGKKIQSLGNRPPAEKAYLSKRHDIILTDLKKAELDLKAKAGK
jgi:hypothetical protein